MHALVGKLMRDCGKAGLFYSFCFFLNSSSREVIIFFNLFSLFFFIY